jgi:polyribonucleotide 5'-hydroxyl-kinase
LTVRLLTGTAERDGTELALNVPYVFSGARSKLLTWHGCTLEVTGDCDDYIVEVASPADSPAVSYLNLHFALQAARPRTGSAATGPRVLVCGSQATGKTSLARTLVALATRQGARPVLASVDPREGLLSLPGTLGAAVFGTLMDVEAADGGIGIGGTPSSGPSAVPVKLPLIYAYGREKPEEDEPVWRTLVSRLAGAVRGKIAEDPEVRASGVIIDAPAVAPGKTGVEMLAHVVDEFAGRSNPRLLHPAPAANHHFRY